jgi:hypothetical protein
MTQLTFTLDDGTGTTLASDARNLTIAGWAGRDHEAVQHHIDELAAIGVTPPSSVPLFYRNSSDRLTQATSVQVLGPDSSGEAEPVLVGTSDGILVTIGSDHTDRALEAYNVAFSKQACPKVIGRQVWRLEDVLPHWDQLRLVSRATIDGKDVLYQDDALVKLRPPSDLLALFNGKPGLTLPAGDVLFMGTVAAIGGIRPASRFVMELQDPVRGRVLSHGYDMTCLPVIA